jgi:hypothetical protein
MRIRTSDHPHREDAIEDAAEFYDCNKTTAVVSACEDVPELVRAARQVLERDDLTARQHREIAETLSTRAVSFDVQTDVDVQRDP